VSYLDRILDDGSNREHWLGSRHPVVGASDAAKLARESSIASVLAAKLSRVNFSGNDYTESGHRWEPMMLAWADIPGNKALIHAPGHPGFAATPDGITADGRTLAECKAKHGRIIDGPTLGEWRQLAWQFECVPEAEQAQFIWVELIDGEIRAGLNGQPKSLLIPRDHPKIVELRAQVLPLATELLERLTVALSYERPAA
jgi:hypothetical protein